jgi:DHA2 family multidrug resistance protein
MALFFVSLLTIMFDGVEPQRVPAASGLSNFIRITTGAFAASIVTTFWDRHAALHQTRLAEATSIYDPRLQQALEGLHDLGFGDLPSIATLTHELANQAYLMSALDFFWISGWLCLLLVAFIWLTRRPRGGAVAAAAD